MAVNLFFSYLHHTNIVANYRQNPQFGYEILQIILLDDFDVGKDGL